MSEENVTIEENHEEEVQNGEPLFIKKCDHCERIFYSVRSLRSHMKVHKEKILECQYCDKKFNRVDVLFTHLTVHLYSQLELFECPVSCCDFKTSRNEDCERHCILEHGQDEMKCEECQTDLGNHRKLYAHKIIAHGELKEYWEEILNIKMASKSEARRKRKHEEIVQENEVNFEVEAEIEEDPPVLEKIEEKKDSKIPETIGILRNAITPTNGETASQMLVKISEHISTLFPQENEEFAYKCSFCSIAFTDAILWMTHLGFHDQDDPLKCASCHKKYENRQAFVIHLTYFAHGPNQMAERMQKLETVLETVIKNFTDFTKTEEPYKLISRDGSLQLGRNDTQLLIESMRERAIEKFRQKMRQTLEDVQMKERFEELEQLEIESKQFNDENAMTCGYTCTDPRDDVKLHILETSNSTNSAGIEAAKDVEERLEESRSILENERAVFNDLAKVIEKQQSVLKNRGQ